MGIKGFYSFCGREIKACHRQVNIIEEISKYRVEHKKAPLILINLSTLSYHFKINKKDFLCGYQLNKIKFDLENFLAKLKDAGAMLEFVFKKAVSDEKEFLRRRLEDYKVGCKLIEKMSKENSFESLLKTYPSHDDFPYNTMLLVCVIQSAANFGPVHGCNMIKGKPTVQQIELARQKDVTWIMGLDTSYFLMPGPWKIWCDTKLNIEELTIQELDPNIVMKHLDLEPQRAPLFACLVGDLQSTNEFKRKVSQFFGSKAMFVNAARFVKRLTGASAEAMVEQTVEKIFGEKFCDPKAIQGDFLKSLKAYEIDEEPTMKVDMEILEMVKNDFMSIAEDILINQPIFINPSFLDLRSTDMKSINDLAMPLLQKTAGILLKNLDDKEPRVITLLMSHDGTFVNVPIKPIYPEFEVPPLKVLIGGEMSTIDKMNMLYWVADLKLKDFELMVITEEYIADCIILLYLMKNESLKILDARCILKTLVDARRRAVPLEVSTEYPEKINERAFRCSFLYSKMYFFFHSCLSSIGMKHLCPDIQFDGVYFQKMYALNFLAQEEKNKSGNEVGLDSSKADGGEEKLQNGDSRVDEAKKVTEASPTAAEKEAGEDPVLMEVQASPIYNQVEIIDDFTGLIQM